MSQINNMFLNTAEMGAMILINLQKNFDYKDHKNFVGQNEVHKFFSLISQIKLFRFIEHCLFGTKDNKIILYYTLGPLLFLLYIKKTFRGL